MVPYSLSWLGWLWRISSPLPIKFPNDLRQIKLLTNKSNSWPSRGGTVLTNRRMAKGGCLAPKNQ